MSFINDKDKLERLDQLIRLKSTGNIDQLAEKFNTSRSTIDRTIKEMKEVGCPIYFSKEFNSYCYEYFGKLLIKFETLDDSLLNKVKGGLFKKNFKTSNSDVEQNYICAEEQQNRFSGFPTPNIKVGLKFLLNGKNL
jgi:predicted transcriptional regulator